MATTFLDDYTKFASRHETHTFILYVCSKANHNITQFFYLLDDINIIVGPTWFVFPNAYAKCKI